MKKEYVIKEANQIKSFYEKNKKMPLTNTYADGKILSIYSTSYLMANLIKNFNSNDIKLMDIIRYNQNTYKDTINEKVVKEDYLKMINNFLNYCKENRRVPTYITTQKSKTKVSFELFVYCLAKIIVYHQNNKTLPNYCIFNKADLQNNKTNTENTNKNPIKYSCTTPYNSIPYNSNKGCDAMGQNTNYYCGVSALQKVLYKFGIRISQKTLAGYAGTTTAGTSHQGLRTAIAYINKKYNVNLSVKEYNFSELGFEKLGKLICKPNCDAITHLYYRLQYGHYEKIKSINTKTGIVEVVNSLGNKCNGGCFCGYIEQRSFSIEKQYFAGISQKSIILITKN